MRLRSLFAGFVVLVGMSVAARADSLQLSLTEADQTVAQGGSATYAGTVTAAATNSGVEEIGYRVTYDTSAETVSWATDLVYSLEAGQSVTEDFFTLTAASLGNYGSTFQIFDASTGAVLATENYSLAVTPAVTPEPGSLMLLGTGVLGMAGLVRRRGVATA